jgi:hypothetical protein
MFGNIRIWDGNFVAFRFGGVQVSLLDSGAFQLDDFTISVDTNRYFCIFNDILDGSWKERNFVKIQFLLHFHLLVDCSSS